MYFMIWNRQSVPPTPLKMISWPAQKRTHRQGEAACSMTFLGVNVSSILPVLSRSRAFLQAQADTHT